MAKHNEIGKKGEDIAHIYITKKGFTTLERNYRRKWGEIDIIAQKDNILHFFEVKTVSRRSFGGHFEQEINNYRPEDNVHPSKLKKVSRAIQTYLLENSRKNPHSAKAPRGEPEWQFNLICVFLDMEKRIAKVKLMENIIL